MLPIVLLSVFGIVNLFLGFLRSNRALLPFALVHSLGYFSPLVVGLLAYSFFGLDALGNELEEPFGTQSNDLPLDALLRTIEIDILTGLNAADIPAPLQPQRHVLT